MQDIQDASLRFFGPLCVAYLSACAGWLALERWKPALWPRTTAPETTRRWLDLALVALAIAGILALGEVYRRGLLFPTGSGALGQIGWIADNLIIYAPMFVVAAVRKQGLRSMYLAPERLGTKLAVGAALALLAVFLFQLLRGELSEFPAVLAKALEAKRLVNFVPVFLEGVALAFGLVRLRWAFGTWPALVVPSLLFAAAHVPGMIDEGRSIPTMIAFAAVNTGIGIAVLACLQRSRDVVWLGVVHYLMDVAIRAV